MRPTRDSGGASNSSSLIWPCSKWGLPCDPRLRRPGALLPHLFTLACAPEGAIGGSCSVALSVAGRNRRPGVTRHPALRSSDFPPPASRRTRRRPSLRTSFVSLVYPYRWSRTTTFGAVSRRRDTRRPRTTSEGPEHSGGHLAVGVREHFMAVLVEAVLSAQADVIGGPKPDAERELKRRTPKGPARGTPFVPAEESFIVGLNLRPGVGRPDLETGPSGHGAVQPNRKDRGAVVLGGFVFEDAASQAQRRTFARWTGALSP